METDICTCKKPRGEHDGTGLNGACLTFAIDRKATYWAERRAVVLARSAKLQADIAAGRVVQRRIFPGELAAKASREASASESNDLLARLAAKMGLEVGP